MDGQYIMPLCENLPSPVENALGQQRKLSSVIFHSDVRFFRSMYYINVQSIFFTVKI